MYCVYYYFLGLDLEVTVIPWLDNIDICHSDQRNSGKDRKINKQDLKQTTPDLENKTSWEMEEAQVNLE